MRSDTKRGCLMTALVLANGFCFGGWVGSVQARHEIRQEAVQHGAARWIVDDEGRREFVWNESGVRDGE